MSGEILLRTDRLIIRDHRKEDLITHHELFSDIHNMYYMHDIMTHSMKESKENLDFTISEIHNPKRRMYFLRIENKETKEHIGEIGYTVLDFTPVGKIVHLGYFTYQKHWNKGYVTEAVNEILRFAFEENEVIRVQTGCVKENIGSERVMQKCGMIKEAEHKCSEWHDGKLKDRLEYRMIKSEWEKSI